MNLEEHIGNAREFLSAIALDDVALPQRMRGRALWGAAHDAINALGHRIGDDDHPTAKITTRQRRVIGNCVERGLLAVSDMDAYMAHAIPLQSHFYGEPMDDARFAALSRQRRPIPPPRVGGGRRDYGRGFCRASSRSPVLFACDNPRAALSLCH